MARLKPEDPLQECLAKIVVDALWRVECYRKSEAQPNLDSHPERESRGRQEQRVMNSMYKALKTLEEMQAQSKLARPAQEDARIDTEKEEKIKTAAALLESKDEEIAQLKARLETIGSLKEDSLKAERLKDQSAGFVSHPSQFHPSASPAGGVPPTGTAAQPAEMEENRAA
jgi:vacuolar-type H+-ATPase subunit I/STV1